VVLQRSHCCVSWREARPVLWLLGSSWGLTSHNGRAGQPHVSVSFIPNLIEMSFTQSLAYAQLKSVFKGELVLPSHEGYRDSLKRWSVLAERQAGVVAFVKDEDDVAAAVKFAVSEKLEIAIKGKFALMLENDAEHQVTGYRWWTQFFRSIFDRWRYRY
jgi:hypothetical protein